MSQVHTNYNRLYRQADEAKQVAKEKADKISNNNQKTYEYNPLDYI